MPPPPPPQHRLQVLEECMEATEPKRPGFKCGMITEDLLKAHKVCALIN